MGSKSSSNSSCVNVADWHIDESVIDLGVVTLQLVFKVVTAAAADTSGRVRLLSNVLLADALPVFSTFPPLHTFSFYHHSFLELLHIMDNWNIFTGQMLILPPNKQHQSTEGNLPSSTKPSTSMYRLSHSCYWYHCRSPCHQGHTGSKTAPTKSSSC